jgi:hypothetical protein
MRIKNRFFLGRTGVGRQTRFFKKSGYSERVQITIAPRTPGIQPHNVRTNTIKTEPNPLSKTAIGGNSKHATALRKLIGFS